MSWTARQEAELARLWADGWSATRIGERIGKSKGAVIGKVYRLDLPRRETKVTKERVVMHRVTRTTASVKAYLRQQARSRNEQNPKPITLPRCDGFMPAPPPVAEVVPQKPTIVTIQDHQCRFPLSGTDAPQTGETPLCGLQTRRGSPYCPEHHARCYTAVPKRVRTAPDPAVYTTRSKFEAA